MKLKALKHLHTRRRPKRQSSCSSCRFKRIISIYV